MSEFQEFVDEVLAAAPGLRAPLGSDAAPDLEIPVLWMGDVGGAVVTGWTTLTESERRSVLAVAERFLTSGSELMVTAVATGFLEALANAVSRGRVVGTELAAVIGPRSRRYLDAYDEFSLGRSSLGPS